MMKYIVAFLYSLVLVSTMHSQIDYRTPFIGEYACTKKQFVNGTTNYFLEILVVTKVDTTDSLIKINGNNINGFNPYELREDGVFHHRTFPNLLYGGFYPEDSLYLYTWTFSQQNAYNEYYCRKIPLFTHEEELQDVRSYYDAVSQCLVVLPEGTGHYDLLVTDMRGRLILRETISGAAQKNMAGFPAGIYAVTVGREGKYMTWKIVKY